jgi:threonine/homoserine/homoserine lactone efflux protein
MTAVTVREGSKSPHAGALIALGHGTFEIPLMILIFTCYSYMNDTIQAVSVKRIISIAGGIFLLLMSADMMISLRKKKEQSQERVSAGAAWISGMVLSAANPYFLIWWATVGAALTFDAAAFGFWGFLLFAFTHWMCDLIWYYLLSFLSYRGGSFFGETFQRTITLACALVLVYFGLFFLIKTPQ